MSALMRCALTFVLVAVLLALAGSGQALAAEPWWHVNTISAPAQPAGGESELVVEASNLGDLRVDGTKQPVTVLDTLPEGVSAIKVRGEGGGGPIGNEVGGGLFAEPKISCSIAGQRVSCTYPGLLLPYERLMIWVTVRFEPGAGTGVNEVSVAGGGALPALSRHPLALGETAPEFGAESYEIVPEEEGGKPATQAGKHPFQLTTTLTFTTKAATVKGQAKSKGGTFEEEVRPEAQPVALTKDLRFNLPPGLVGNPTPLPKCSLYLFVHNSARECPVNTVVGVATPIVTAFNSLSRVPMADTAPLYNLEPAIGEPARFGFPTPVGPVILNTSVRTGEGYGVVVTVPDIIDALGFIGSQVTFWGVPADPRHDSARGLDCLIKASSEAEALQNGERSCSVGEREQPFLDLPTSCTGPLQTSVEGDSWYHIGAYTKPFSYTFANLLGEQYGQDGCNKLSFNPSIGVAPDGQQGSTPTGLTVSVHVDQQASLNPTGLADATVKDTTVILPAGVALNPAGADGLLSCGLGEIGLEVAGEQSCPEAAKVGTVEIETPLLPHRLEGAAYLASQGANPFGSLIALYIVAKDPVSGVIVKLAGEVRPDGHTGQLVSTFKETPQLPFENLRLHFFGGSRAPLGTPALCESYATTASIAPWSGEPPVGSSSEFQITSGPNHAPCSNPLPFSPELTTGSLNIQAGAFTPFTTTMSRQDGQQNLQSLQLHMPPGLSGLLTGVELCPEPQADEGLCGANSLIGETTVSVGLGGNPFSVKGGRVYITGPYEGAPFGLSIVNPAKAGPFDLEKTKASDPACDCVVVRAKIEVDPTTAALTISSDSTGPYKIPTIIEGIPLEIQHVNVTIDRPSFTFNPTNCNKMEISGNLRSTEGASQALSVPFQATNCATLRFKPSFKVSTSGHTSRAKGASLDVKLSYPKAAWGSQANIRSVKVDLPKQLPSRLTTLQKACPDTVFNANPANCPAASRVGQANATTPLIPVSLTGPAYFVSHGGAKFPELIVVLQGYGVTVDLHGETFISKAGITSSTFRTVPDVPVGTFELELPQGRYSALAANGNLCKTKLTMPTAFAAQNGTSIKRSTPITTTGCAQKKRKKARKT
ncbi:MAG: hypothetical protein WA484_13370 [Solirubrobacteraceae bacterium]